MELYGTLYWVPYRTTYRTGTELGELTDLNELIEKLD